MEVRSKMSSTSIKFKRGNKADLPQSAPSGTPLWCEDSHELYMGTGNGVTKASKNDVVEDKVIIELKAVADLRPEHEWQLVNYLVACHKEIGLLLNFGHSLKVKRKLFTKGHKYK